MNTYVYEKIDHRPGGNAALILSSLRGIFESDPAELSEVRRHATEVAELVIAMGTAQEKACSAVCPACRSVCCINRHACHEHEDLVYLAALGEKMPSYDMEVPDTAPCQFLGEQGCSVSRHLRPHRCNAYFCSPMLEYLENGPSSEYRRFIRGLERVTEKREEMLAAFYSKAYSL